MAKIIIASPRLSDAATLNTTETIAANYPLSNLLTRQPGERARFAAPGSVFVEVDFGSAQSISFAALLAHNGSSAATWRIRAAATQSALTSAPVYDSTSVSLWPATGKPDADLQHSFKQFAAQSLQWWRIDVADAGNADGYFQAGRLVLDAAFQPGVNLTFGYGIGWLDPSPVDQSVAGHSFPLDRPKRRVLTLPFSSVNEEDMLTGIYELQRRRGAGGDVFVVIDPDATTHLHRKMLHGLMFGSTSPIVSQAFQRWQTALRVEELLA